MSDIAKQPTSGGSENGDDQIQQNKCARMQGLVDEALSGGIGSKSMQEILIKAREWSTRR